MSQVQVRTGSRYPSPYDEPCRGRHILQLADAGGLTKYGVNLVTLPTGGWSSQRHWHELEDEFLYMLEGEAVLVEDEGETILRPGDAAAFKAGTRNGHKLENRSTGDVRFLIVGDRNPEDWGEYSDIDMRFNRTGVTFTKKDGSRIK